MDKHPTRTCLQHLTACLVDRFVFLIHTVSWESLLFFSLLLINSTPKHRANQKHISLTGTHIFFFLNTCVQHNHGGDNQWDCLLLYESHNHASFTVKSDALMFSIKTLNFHPTWLSNSLSVVCSLYYTKLSGFFSLCVMLCLWLIKTCVQLFYPKKLPTSQHRLPY